MVINTKRSLADIEAKLGTKWRLAIIDATKIARELLGVPIVNTTMIGALIKTTGLVRLESLLEPLKDRFGRLAESYSRSPNPLGCLRLPRCSNQCWGPRNQKPLAETHRRTGVESS